MPPRRERSAAEEAREAEAFGRDALAHLDALYAFARWLSRNAADADDLVQETMLKGLRARASFRPGTNLRAWLFTILRRTFLNAEVRARREVPISGAGLDGARPEGAAAPDRLRAAPLDPEPALIAAASRDAIDAALGALSREYREAVWLCDVEEFTVAEAAAVLGCPVGTVKSRVSRGRARLRALLKDYAR